MNPASARLIETIRAAIIGADQVLDGPYGSRRVTYADYTASGRSLEFLEDFLRDEVMTLYANTHTESSGTGRQTAAFREDARAIIPRAVGGGADDLVIFTGSGATGAINKLIDILNLRIPRDLDTRYGLSRQIPRDERPVVFIGPFEHHSNELPWRESIAEVRVIQEDGDGHIDLEPLERELVRFAARPLKIGSFSAASNVTGIASDTRAIAELLHRHGAYSLWDYAAAGPYVAIEMNPGGGACKDAVFISPHKFIGGARRARRSGRQAPPPAQHRPGVPGRRHGRVRQRGRAPLPHRSGAPRGGRDPGDHRVDPRWPVGPAQGGGRRRCDPRARARAPAARDRELVDQPQPHDPRQSRRVPAVDRVVRGSPPHRAPAPPHRGHAP